MPTTAESTVTIDDVRAARERIEGGIYHTPCPESVPLSELCDARVFCKLEYLQRTGSFKERGARNALMLLSDEQKRRGIVSTSAGNHALALAYHGKLLGIRVTVVMPTTAPLVKSQTCAKLGASVVQHGEDFGEAYERARQFVDREGMTYVHGYDDPAIIAGAGTIGLEVLEQAPGVEAILVPIGGGGLITGIGIAVKALRPDVRIIGVESAATGGLTASLDKGEPVSITPRPTLADGLAVHRAGALPVRLAPHVIDHIVRVEEEAISLAILRILELEKGVVEGAGAVTLAAVMNKHGGAGLFDQMPELAGRRIALILSGGNIDPTVLSRVIENGLVADGRLCRFTATISDRPGGLARFASIVAKAGASVKEIIHDRAFCASGVNTVNVLCLIETRDRAHIHRLHDALRAEGIPFTPHDVANG